MSDDAELLHRYATTRSEAAFGTLVQRYLDLVYFSALRRCQGDPHRAEDVTQEVFMLLARQAAPLARHAVLAGWLFVTTRNVAAKALRAERVRRAREAEAGAMSEVLGEAADGPVVDWDRLRPVLDDVLDELSERDRDAVLLRFFSNRPFADIGVSLRLTEDAARMRVARALDKLRELLARRGITSTSAALATALANQAAAAKPAGLAASVTASALTGAGVAAALGGGAAALGLMSTGKLSITGAVLAALVLAASLGGNVYLFTHEGPSAEPAAPVPAAPVAAPAPAGDPFAAFVAGGLGPLRDRLRGEGASEAAVRSVLEGILRRRYRERLSEDRTAKMRRGWWRNRERTWGTVESFQRLLDDPMLLHSMVTVPLEQLLGPDPLAVAEAEVKYAFLPAELRQALGRLERALPGGWSRTGDPAVDDRQRADHEAARQANEEERAALLAGLTPLQRAEYEMRLGQFGTMLAYQLEPVGATEEEFRTVFPLAEVNAKEFAELLRQENPQQKMEELDRRMVRQLIAGVGYERALDFVWGGAPEYPAYARVAHDAGLPAGTAGRVLQLAHETEERAAAVHAEAALSLEEKTAALRALQQWAQPQFDALIPPAAQPRLPPAALEWVQALGEGSYKPIVVLLPGRGRVHVITGTVPVSGPVRAGRPATPLVPPRPARD